MLPEKLSFALALIAAIVLLYLGEIHAWEWELRMLSVVFAALVFMLVGRIVGVISARELAKAFALTEHEADAELRDLKKDNTKTKGKSAS